MMLSHKVQKMDYVIVYDIVNYDFVIKAILMVIGVKYVVRPWDGTKEVMAQAVIVISGIIVLFSIIKKDKFETAVFFFCW